MAVAGCHATFSAPDGGSGKRNDQLDGVFETSTVAGAPLMSRLLARTFVTDSLKATVIWTRLVFTLPGAGVRLCTSGGAESAIPAVSSELAKKSTSLELTLNTCTARTFVPRRRALVKALICPGLTLKIAPEALLEYGMNVPGGPMRNRRTSTPLIQVM